MLAKLRKALSLLSPGLRLCWLALVPLSLLEAVLESAGAAAVFALIKIMGDPTAITGMPVIAQLFESLGLQNAAASVPAFTAVTAGFFIFKNLFQLAFAYVRSAMTARTVTVLSSGLLLRYLQAPLAFYFRRNSAGLVDRVLRSTDHAVRKVLEAAVACISEVLVLCGMVAVLVAAAPAAALVCLAVVGSLLGAVLLATSRLFYRLGKKQQSLSVRSLELLQQAFGGIRDIKAMDRERHWAGLFLANQQGLEAIRTWHATLNTAPRLLVETVFVCISLGFIIAAYLWPAAGQAALPLVGLFAYAGFRAIPACNRIAMHVNNIRYGAVEAELLYEDCRRFEQGDAEERAAAAAPPVGFSDRLAAEDIDFSYSPQAEPVLTGVRFDIRRGEAVAIVGATGAGKSTLVDILLGLLEPRRGRVTVDGLDIRGREAGWRSIIGYVPQAVYLAHDSLRRNIAFGSPDCDIAEERVREALGLAQLEEFVAGLPEGLATVIGERGLTISGGEKQRVAIARALYRRPRLLVLDEATAALDSRTEQALAQAIRALRGRITVLLVAHRMQTVEYCDRILFLHGGTVAASGTWDELMQHSEAFRELARAGARKPA